MNCPKCGKEMEEGFIVSNYLGMAWSKKPVWENFSSRTERLSTFSMSGTSSLPGFRCTECRMVLANY
jgi:hypothetical protein